MRFDMIQNSTSLLPSASLARRPTVNSAITKSATATASAISHGTPKVATATTTPTSRMRKVATIASFTRKRMRTSA